MSYSVTGTFYWCNGATGAAVSVLSMILESVSLNVPVKLKLDNNINAISIVMSKCFYLKSVVFELQHLRTAYSR
jgi:hypothetical protein